MSPLSRFAAAVGALAFAACLLAWAAGGGAIVDAARETGAELIVVGTRGRSVAARTLLGSVSAKVVERAPCEVEVV